MWASSERAVRDHYAGLGRDVEPMLGRARTDRAPTTEPFQLLERTDLFVRPLDGDGEDVGGRGHVLSAKKWHITSAPLAPPPWVGCGSTPSTPAGAA